MSSSTLLCHTLLLGKMVKDAEEGNVTEGEEPVKLEVFSGSPLTNNFYIGATAGEVFNYACRMLYVTCYYDKYAPCLYTIQYR